MMNQANKCVYLPGTLTMKDIEDAIKRFDYNGPRRITLYTDQVGYEIYQLMANLQLIFGPKVRSWQYIPKRVSTRFIYVSLFEKHGFLKFKIYLDGRRLKYELFNATTSIGVSDKPECLNVLKRLHERLS